MGCQVRGLRMPAAPTTCVSTWAICARVGRAQSCAMLTSQGPSAVLHTPGAVAPAARRHPALLLLLCSAVLAGCATRAVDVRPKPGDPAAYAGWDCERLFEESDQVQLQAADVAYAVDTVVGNNMVALGLGVTVFWPALLAMRPDGPEATQLADLKGRFEAMRSAAAAQACGAPPLAMTAKRQAGLPVAVGDRLIYDDRSGLPVGTGNSAGNNGVAGGVVGGVAGSAGRVLSLQVTALLRDRIEFRAVLDGQALATPWQQDLAGNAVVGAPAPLIAWRRLLRSDLTLGQVVTGELAAAGELLPSARLRGQVVATGPQTVAGQTFDVAVIELFGEAPRPRSNQGEVPQGSARLDGSMAVDRHSGLLLRLDMRCDNPDFALRRRLVRLDTTRR